MNSDGSMPLSHSGLGGSELVFAQELCRFMLARITHYGAALAMGLIGFNMLVGFT